MIPGVGPYSALFTPKAGSLFHAVFQSAGQQATGCIATWLCPLCAKP